MSTFDVRKAGNSAGIYVVDSDIGYVVADDDPDRALRTMDTFIGDAVKARQELKELIANDEA